MYGMYNICIKYFSQIMHIGSATKIVKTIKMSKLAEFRAIAMLNK